MATKVYANGLEIACKSAAGRGFFFPDPCYTPPAISPPPPPGAIPLPIPYPNVVDAKNITKGTKKVHIKRKEVSIENKSFFKKSTGDEAGSYKTPPYVKGVLVRTNKGKGYFIKGSMNVKFQKKGVHRNLDSVTHNHSGQMPPNTATGVYISESFFCSTGDC
jgi:hypothetical protein